MNAPGMESVIPALEPFILDDSSTCDDGIVVVEEVYARSDAGLLSRLPGTSRLCLFVVPPFMVVRVGVELLAATAMGNLVLMLPSVLFSRLCRFDGPGLFSLVRCSVIALALASMLARRLLSSLLLTARAL